MAKPTPEQLAKINTMAKKELTADEVYVHNYRLIGTKFIPSHALQFDRSLLDIYLSNVLSGDVVQIADHSFGAGLDGIIPRSPVLPYGRFFDGQITQEGEDFVLDGTMYMLAGVPSYIQGMTTDDLNKMLDGGTLKDSSVSAGWGRSECSICHNDIRDYENCKHIPGRYYNVNEQQVQCYVIAKPAPPPRKDNSQIYENSDVVAGAYPDAKTFSAKPPNEQSGKTGKLNLNNIADLKLVNKDAPVFCCLSSTSATFQVESENLRDASELHQLYHSMYSDGLPEGWTMAKLTAKHKEAVKELLDAGHEHLMSDALDGTLNEALKGKSKKGSENTVDEKEKLALEKQVTDLTADVQGFTVKIEALEKENGEFKAKVDELTPLAALGTKYRDDVIEDAIKAGVRDNAGSEFAEEGLYRKMFETLSIDEIKSFGEKWEASALAKLGVPAGHTKGEKLELPGSELAQAKDPNLYKVGRK